MQIRISELVSQAQKGDREAFSKLYQLTFRDSYYLALKIAENESEAAEIVEESYKKAFSSIHTLKNSENIEAWIKHITAIKCVDFLKSKKQIDFNSEQTSDHSETIEEGIEFLPEGFEKSEKVTRIINKIIDIFPVRKKVVTLLYYYNKMPAAYIAKTLGCTENDVNKELGAARAEIKGYFDKKTDKEIPLSPLSATPVLALILHSAKQQQSVETDLLRSIFASATEGMFDTTEKLQPETNSVYEPVIKEEKKADIPAKKKEKEKILNKINSLTKKQKTIAIICICAFLVLIIVGGFLIGYLNNSGSSEGEIAEADSEMIKKIEPFQEVYDKILQECYSYEGEDWQKSQFTFAYVDDNEIPDMIFMTHETDEDIGLIYMNGNGKDHEDNMMVQLSHTWFGEDGSMVILKEYVGEYYYKEIYRTYEEYKYVDGEKTVVKRLQYKLDEDSEGIVETWTCYENNELKELKSMTEFNVYVKELLNNYKKVVAGYSVKDYIESGKTIAQYIKKAEALVYDYLVKVELLPEEEETTDTPEKTDYIWQESAVLNSYESIKFYSENTCIIEMKENGMYGLIDSMGNVVVQPEYEYGFDWCTYGPGTVHYLVKISEDESRLIDLDNGYVVEDSYHDGHGYDLGEIPDNFQDMDIYSNGLVAAQKNGKWGYVDENLNTVIPFSYERVETHPMLERCRSYDGKYIPVKKGGKMGIINKENETLVPFEYSVIMQGKDGIFIAQKDGKWGFIGIGATPKEPAKAKVMAKTPEWEKNYTKLLKEEYEMNYFATLKDVDKNGIPDLIVYDRWAQTDFIYMYMNGDIEDEYDENIFGGTSLYENSKGEYAVYSLYHSGQDVSESYSKIKFESSGRKWLDGFSYVKQANYVDVPIETWYKDEDEYIATEITKEEYEAYVKSFEKEYKPFAEFDVYEFIESGDALSKYIK